jgi:hypothetical protein
VTEPWLSGLLACALNVDAEELRRALHRRGLKTRSVPAGRAKAAWTCVTDRGTLAIVVAGRGAEGARQAASFWMPRARWLALATAGPGTADPAAQDQPHQPALVLDGDPELAVLAARGAPPGTTTTQAKVAAVSEPTLGPTARQTLAEAGYAAWDPAVDTWRQAATAVGGVVLIAHAILDAKSDEATLLQQIPDGATARPWWRAALATLSGSARRRYKQQEDAYREAIRRAAECAVAALLGTA